MAHSCPSRHGPEPIDCAQLPERKHLGGLAQKPIRIPRRPAGPRGGHPVGDRFPHIGKEKKQEQRYTTRECSPMSYAQRTWGHCTTRVSAPVGSTKPSRRPNLTSLKQDNAQPQTKHNDTPSRLRTRLPTWTTTKYRLHY